MTADSTPTDRFVPRFKPASVFVVGLGASAGGITALKQFFAHVPPNLGTAYVVILHLSPDHDSQLAEVLQTTARLPVAQVTARTPIVPDRVYVVSPNKSLSIVDNILTVDEFTRPEQRRSPVDVFFRALADSQGSRAVCVILSGTGPNGSAGLKRVKEYGGLVLAQDPDEAEHGDMPRNAIGTGLVDLVLPVAEMPAKIAGYFDRIRRHDENPQPPAEPADDAAALREILALLRVRTGQDFSNYKSPTLQRRIERRMTLRGATALAGYARTIRQEPDEAVALMKELLISVTSFFRDVRAWQALEQRVIPRIFLNRSLNDQVRVWVPGCATGEEAYSIAMLLTEHADGTVDPPSIQVFATDLDQEAIHTAREGLYTGAEIADVSEERVQRFFRSEARGVRIRRELREMVLFAPHNVIKDPPFSHIDLICCRNLLIYLNRAIQERIIDTFHFALRPGGYLFLGTSESPDGPNDLFLRFDPTAHIYESRTVTSRIALPIADRAAATARGQVPAESRSAERMVPADLHQRILEQFAPPSVIITDAHNIVHMSERAGRFLQLRGGEITRDLLVLARAELRPDLRAALFQAAADRTGIEVRGVPVAFEDGIRAVDIAVRPVLRDGQPANGFFLVTFDERSERPSEHGGPPLLLVASPADPTTHRLEEELARIKAQLRTTIEQHETQVEEVRASNEELQAMNEELRSAAEELETSKEELQSVNEELTTVNQELKIKIEELGLTNNDFHNFITAVDVGAIFLDLQLRVKFSTPRAREVFNLIGADTGRPLSDITSRLLYDRTHADARAVLDHLSSIEQEVQTNDGRWRLMRILPYRTTDNRINGVVITFQEITERRLAEDRVRQSEERLRLMIDGALDYAIFTMNDAGIIDSWNPGAQRMLGYAADEIIGAHVELLFTPEDRANGAMTAELEEARSTGRAADERYHLRKDGIAIYCSGVTHRLGGGGIGFAKIARDLSTQRQTALALQTANEQLETRVFERTAELRAELRAHEAAKDAVTALLRRLVTAQEDERTRIARDLHDHVGQQLTALRLTVERAGNPDAPAADRAVELDRALALTQQLGRDLDFLAWELRPATLDEFGLAAALPRFVTEWSAHVGIAADFRSGGFEPGHLRAEDEVMFYRVTQEALNNAAKHAHASRVDVILAVSDGHVVLVVEDDGVGFDVATRLAETTGVGLAGMRERAGLIGGTLQIESATGKGTSVFLSRAIRATEPPAGEVAG